MHKCELITKHAMGQVTRKCNKQVVDSFPQMEIFRSKIRKFASSIMDMKQKSKYKQYVKFVEPLNNGKQPLKLETPNDTRATGTMMRYQSMLRSYWDLQYYMWSSDTLQSLKNIYPMPDEWDTMRETDELLRSTEVLSMNSQTNTPAAVARSPLLVCFAQSKLPRACSDLVRNIVCLTLNKPAWQGIRALHKDKPKEIKRLNDYKETTQMLVERLSKEYKLTSIGTTSLPCSIIPSWIIMVCT